MDENPDARSLSRVERIALNEAWRRRLNGRKAEWMDSRLPTAGFRCECGQMHCDSRLQLSLEQWDEVHARSDRFLVVPEHVAGDVEVVVAEYPNFWLIQKQGEAKKIVEKLD
jgi:hypothetical protein